MSTKKILILDDNLARHQGFAGLLPNHALTHAFTYSAAVEALRNNEFDIMCLDHDLAEGKAKEKADGVPGFGPNGLRYLTGLDFVQALLSDQERCPPKVMIHSWNDYGAQCMERTVLFYDPLPKIWVRPFVYWAESPCLDFDGNPIELDEEKKQSIKNFELELNKFVNE